MSLKPLFAVESDKQLCERPKLVDFLLNNFLGIEIFLFESIKKIYIYFGQSGRVHTHQYSVTIDDGIKSVSNSEDCALLKLVPYSLLDEAVSSKRARNTTPQHKNPFSLNTLGQGIYLIQNNG